MRPSSPTETPAGPSPATSSRARRAFLGAAIVAVVSVASFVPGVTDAPTFPDETAYVAQSYYLDLLMSGRRDDWAWVEYHAYDLPPLPKYAFGAALHAAGRPLPDRLTAGLWFRDITRALVPRASIVAARWPVVALAAAGCLGLYALGSIAAGTRTGLAAAVLLAINPLYRLHAHRAMSDAPAESLMLLALAAGLAGWVRLMRGNAASGLAWTSGAGLLAGLAALAKLNGLLAVIVLLAWCGLGLALSPRGRRPAFLTAAALASTAALAAFVALNPYVMARPTGSPPPLMMGPAPADEGAVSRLVRMLRHRIEVSERAKDAFPHNALRTPADKLIAAVAQGFGRFGPLGPQDHDSTVPYPRFSWSRDWGALPWGLAVAAGAVVHWRRGRAQRLGGEPPSSWAVLTMAALAFSTVTAFLPLAWDRYYLSLQPAAALLGGAALVEATRRASRPPRRDGHD